jgi:hypothetical protein
MQLPATTAAIAQREAMRWLNSQLRWERALSRLRKQPTLDAARAA